MTTGLPWFSLLHKHIYSEIQLFLVAENGNDEWLYQDEHSVDRAHKSLMISGLLGIGCFTY